MASVRRNMVVIVVAMAAAAALHSTIAFPDFCPPDIEGQVYPYWSRCFSPAVYFKEEYKLVTTPWFSPFGVLAPEYDEANATYYLRVQASEGATYKLTHRTKENRPFVAEADDVIFVNTQTGRALAWREEGEGELFLVEASIDVSGPALLQFVDANIAKYGLLACPLIVEARCKAYFIVDFTASGHGLSPYEEDGVTYFKRGSDMGLPLLLVRATSGDSAVADHAASESQVQLAASA